MIKPAPGVGRVLHAAQDIAGQASRSVRGLRLVGVEADLYASPHPFGYDSPDIVPPDDKLGLMRAIATAARSHDTFHFHFGEAFHPRLHLYDARALRAAGRRVVVEFHGSDVRMPSIAAADNPYYVALPGEDDASAERLMARWAKITAGHAICCDRSLSPFLERHFEHINYVGQRVEVARYSAHPPDVSVVARLVVAHAPSNTLAKGTAFVREAVRHFDDIDYIEITGGTHDETVAAMTRADLVIDQLCIGSHGVLAVEAMSMAKPVICFLLPEYAATMPDGCPIIQANPDTIRGVLSSWRDRRADLHELGLASRAYAERNYDVTVVARRLVAAYSALPHR